MSDPALRHLRPASRSAARQWLPLIVGLAVGLRLALGLVHPFVFDDSRDYLDLARAIVTHQPYQVNGNIATRMPGYPLLLAAVFGIAGESTTAIVSLQALMGGAIALFTYAIGRRCGEAVALLAAALVAVDPLSVGFSASVLSETPFTLCLLAALWMAVELAGRLRGGLLMWIALGACWGIAVTLRASALWCIVPLASAAAWFSARRPNGLPLRNGINAAVAVTCVFLVLTPWLARNYKHFHSGPLRLTTLEGISLYEAVYPAADGGPRQDKIELPPDMRALSEAQRNDAWARQAWGHIRSDPMRIAGLAVVKVGRTWAPQLNINLPRPIQWALLLWHVPLFGAAIVGVLTVRRDVAVLLLVPVLYFSAVHALFLGSVRYRVPLMPIVCLFASAGILWATKWLTHGKRSPDMAV